MLYLAIVFLPLLGFLIAGLFGSSIGAKASEYVTTGLLIVCAVLSWIAFATVALGHGEAFKVPVAHWVESGSLSFDWALRIDTLTVVMLVVVNTVSALVHTYSIGYMHHDPDRPRFFAYLSLFTFAMLMLVTGDNLVQMFFGWEGVGLASYLLIGFWFKKPSANAAAIKAFVVNRVGDFGFLLGIFSLFVLFDTVQFDTLFASAAQYLPAEGAAEGGQTVLNFLGYALDKQGAITIACLLLFMGAMGKSAQFLLHTWLPDAMEGPTPVSALIHAATMVTAGVFMVARLSPIFELSHTALIFVTFIGATTAFFAATVGLVQNDIKRVIAYSTCSQLGYMFVALGLGAYGAGIFHLFTHAFFKALLFLGAGSVIHAVSDEQDMRHMGGLRTLIPKTYWMMIVGTVALTGLGIPGTLIGTAGFFSKDMIIESAFASHSPMASYAFILLVVAAIFTSFYSWRLIFMTFHGKPRASHDVMHHVHESPYVMLVPLFILAAGALFAGVIFREYFFGHEYAEFWKGAIFTGPENEILEEHHHVPFLVAMSPFLAMAVGFIVAWYFYIRSPETPRRLAAQHPGLYQFLLNKWYFDELYDFLFVRPTKALGRFLWKQGDGWLIDGHGPDGISARVVDVTNRVVRLQSGYLYHYAFAMLIGVAALVTWMMLGSNFLMTDWPILSTVTFLPLVGALLVLMIRDDSDAARRNIRNVTLWTTIITFLLSLPIWYYFDNGQAGFQFVEKADWLDSGISYHMGVDGISMLFVILTTFLMPLCILASWEAIQTRVKEYMIAFLVLETLMIGVFCALDIVLFYVFFEAVLVPMFIIIGVWGGKRRVYASFKFFLYTLLGSVLMLLAIMAMYWQAGTTDIPTLLAYKFPASLQTWLWFAFFASFAVKMPMWPVHTWLPDAHVEAPTAASAILAGILLKLGGYGFIRFSLPMFPIASADFAPLIYTLSVVAIIYTSLVALAQQDIKKLIAYSSVAHMGYVTMGIFAANEQGIQGAIFQMLSHGLVSSALFLCVGIVYDRTHTREIAAYGGLVNNMPKYAVVFMIFTMANVGLPGTSGFIGEFLTLLGVFRVNTWVALFATSGVIFSAAYALWLYRRVIFGALDKESLKSLLDMSPREKAVIYPLVILTIFYGVYPMPIFDATASSVHALINQYNNALSSAATLALK